MLILLLGVISTVSCAAVASNVVQIPLEIDNSMYTVNLLSLGLPAQSVSKIVLDTGSSDLVITHSVYDITKSTSAINTNLTFSMQYGSSDLFYVFAVNETLVGDDFKLSKFPLGYPKDDLIRDIVGYSGILGLGFRAFEALFRTSNNGKGVGYANFPQALKEQGITKSSLFSLNGQSDNPYVIFGGVDTNAYEGPLVKVPIVFIIGTNFVLDYYLYLDVTVNQVTFNNKEDKTVIANQPLAYWMDTGADSWLTTPAIYKNLYNCFQNTKLENDITWILIKELKKISITFNIAGFDVTIPLTDLIDTKNGDYASLKIDYATIGTETYQSIIPNAVYKYMYTVFDLDNGFVYLGKSSSSQRQAIKSVTNAELPVPTTTLKEYTNSYTTLYKDSLETMVASRPTSCKKKH